MFPYHCNRGFLSVDSRQETAIVPGSASSPTSPVLYIDRGSRSIHVTVRNTGATRISWFLLKTPEHYGGHTYIHDGWIDPMGYMSEVFTNLEPGGYIINLSCPYPRMDCSGVAKIEVPY